MPSIWERWRAFSERILFALLLAFAVIAFGGAIRLWRNEHPWWLIALCGLAGVGLTIAAAWKR